ncbi:hypothetical protein PAMP_001166 [Pampus punctatissimus]
MEDLQDPWRSTLSTLGTELTGPKPSSVSAVVNAGGFLQTGFLAVMPPSELESPCSGVYVDDPTTKALVIPAKGQICHDDQHPQQDSSIQGEHFMEMAVHEGQRCEKATGKMSFLDSRTMSYQLHTLSACGDSP